VWNIPEKERGRQFSKLFAAFLFLRLFTGMVLKTERGKPCFGIAAYPILSAVCPKRAGRATAHRLSPFDFDPFQKSNGGKTSEKLS
jgi:hypothetical protein